MATETELLAHVKESISVALGADPDSLHAGTKLFAELGVDSVDLLDIAYEIERLTGCELEVQQLIQTDEGGTPKAGADLTLDAIVAFLRAKGA